MAKYLDKDPEVYARERDGFLRDLKHFHETRGTPFRRAPKLSGHPIDLYLLYSLVTGRGGWIKVNYRNQWSELFEALEIPICVNASIALKQIYLRYLDRWEKVHYLGEEVDRGSDDDEESRHKRWSARALHSVPLSYNYNQHCVSEVNREYHNLSTNIYKKSDYDRLALSLISPLPNEQDFAINVCTLLSNDGKHTLKLEKHARILDYLLAHAGVFNHGSLRRLFMHSYTTVRKQAIHNFWRDAVSNDEYIDLTVEPNSNSTFSNPSTSLNHLNNCPNTTAATSCKNTSSRKTSISIDNTSRRTQVQTSDYVNGESVNNSLRHVSSADSGGEYDGDGDCVMWGDGETSDDLGDTEELKRRKWNINETDKTLFNLGRNLGTRDYMGQRVLQIATILRNLSFIEENITTLSNNRSFIRFMLLCTASRWNQLQNLGLDMLGNVAGEILVRDLATDRLPAILLKLICEGLQTEDRHWCISALEVLNKLSQNTKNEDTLLRVLEPEVYKRVCSFLTIHDVMLLIYTLECLYSLSSLGERSCNLIVSNFGVVDTLVSLVTVEGKSYGPKACIGMKLVETVTGAAQQQQQQTQVATSPPPLQQSAAQAPSTSIATVVATISAASPHTISAPAATPVSISGVTTGPGGSTFSSAGKGIATILGAVVVSPSTAAVKNAAITQQTKLLAHQQANNVGNTTALSPSPLPTPPPKTPPPPPVSIIKPSPTPKAASSSSSSPSASTSSNPFAQQQGGATSPIITAQQLVQQQHAHQQAIQENEQFALTWLRTTYEPCAILGNVRVDSQELYKHYITSCQRIGRRGVIAPLHFPRCVRSVFGGTVGPNPAKPSGSSEAQFYDGIKVREKPLLLPQSPNVNQTQKNTPTSTTSTNKTNSKANSKANNSATATNNNKQSSIVNNNNSQSSSTATSISPASPILKAQLSAPPKQQQQQHQQRDSSNISPTNITNSTPTSADKSQVKSHPHLSQALMSSSTTSTTSSTSTSSCGTSTASVSTSSKGSAAAVGVGECSTGSSTSLIKSLLATKVNNNNVNSMQPSEAQVLSTQVAARQQKQRLLAQQTNQSSDESTTKKSQTITLKRSSSSNPRLNGARQLFPLSTENNTQDSISSSTISSSSTVIQSSSTISSLQHTTVSSSRREPPQPPPPPLIALSGGGGVSNNNHSSNKRQIDNEDSDSIGNNSLASSTGPAGIGCVSSTEDGENSLASFDGLINGVPSVDEHETIMLLNDSDDSEEERDHVVIKKPLMLADLLEKKVVDREPPIINGILSKELRIGDKGLQLVENHIDKVLGSMDSSDTSGPIIDQVDGASDEPTQTSKGKGKKRIAGEELNQADLPNKKMLLSQGTSNNRIAIITSPPLIDNSSNSTDNEDLNSGTVSTAAAKLFADMAADIMEDEDDEDDSEVIPAAPREQQQQQTVIDDSSAPSRVQQSQVIVPPRQMMVSQAPSSVGTCSNVITSGGMMLASGTQLKTQSGQTVIVQNVQNAQHAVARPQQVIMQQGPPGQILLSQAAGGQLGQLGQMQLVATGQSGGQPTQYVIQTSGGPGAQNFVVAQPQTAVVHGQQQTVLVAQTAQQVGGQGGKTIIILQPTQVQQMQQQMQQVQQHVQKVVMGPHGQHMVVTTPVSRSSTITTTQGTITLSAAPPPPPPQSPQITHALTPTTIITTTNPPPTILNSAHQQPTILNNTNMQVQSQQKVIINSATASDSCSHSATKSLSAANRQQNSGVIASTSTSQLVTAVTSTSSSVVTAAVKSTPAKKKAQTVATAAAKDALFICEWANCHVETMFKSANQVFMHVCEEHCKEPTTCPAGSEELLCLWDRCDNMKRKRFSLMTHLQDKHCNLEAMRASLMKRKQVAHGGKSEPAVQSPPSQPHPGYAPDAAFHAIKRHALEFVNPKELQDDNEGPVTKSIRLTASLILRNLVIYSSNCRRFLKPYEPHLANVALSNVESSRTIAQVLYDMNDSPHHHHHHHQTSSSR